MVPMSVDLRRHEWQTAMDYVAAIEPVPATVRIACGSEPSQWMDLFLPAGAGPFPLVILVHGGCWRTRASAETLSPNAAELAAAGIAACCLEYRRIGEDGSGYPGTYLDLGAAADALRGEADRYGIDLSRVVIVGHSAGAHLALWLGARHRLPADSALRVPDPLMARTIVAVAGPGDLRRHADLLAITCKGLTVDDVVGVATPERPDRFADTSPSDLLPLGVRTVSINAHYDDNWPPYVTARWRIAALAAGDDAEELLLADCGHFELVDVREPAWGRVRDVIVAEIARTA